MTADVRNEYGYFAQVPAWVLDADISAQAVRLYAVLWRIADYATREAHPSRKTLADRLHVQSLRTVDAAVADLVRIGAVEIVERWTTAGDRDANGYILKREPLQGVVQEIARPVVQEIAQQKNESQLEREKNTPPLPLKVVRDEANEDEDFVAFWKAYPHRPNDSRAAGRKAWKTARKSASVESIMKALKGYRFDEKEDRRFVPMSSTWLNRKPWEDADTGPKLNGAQRLLQRLPWE